MFITKNRHSFHLWWKENLVKYKKVSKYYAQDSKLDKSILSSELEVDGYDLVRLDQSRRGDGVTCYIKSLIAYSYKDSFCSNTESIFVDIFFLPKFKSILLGISYRAPSKSDFVKHINNIFTETRVSDKQECYS